MAGSDDLPELFMYLMHFVYFKYFMYFRGVQARSEYHPAQPLR